MACLDMYNSEHKGHHHQQQQQHHFTPVSPRISFSNDFVDAQQASKLQEIRSSTRSDAPPVSTDFEFSVTNYSMMSADELFCKGRLLPFKEDSWNNNLQQVQRPVTTLREELLMDDDDECQGFSLRPPKGSSSSTRWKGFLGLRKSHIGSNSKKVDKSEGSSSDSHRGVEAARSGLVNEGARLNMSTSQELLIEGGSSSRDVEIGI